MGAQLPENALLRSLLELLPAGVLVLDREGRLALANPAASSIWPGPLGAGESPRLAPGTRWTSGSLAVPEDWAGARALRDQVPVLGQALWVTGPDGHTRLVIHSAVPLQAASGPYGALVLLQDLSELKALEVRHAAVLASMGEALLCLDGRSRISQVNSAAEALFGHPEAKLVGSDLSVVVDPQARPSLESLLAEAPSPTTLRTRLRRAGGEPLEAEVTASRFQWDGQHVHALLVRDVAERVRAESESHLLAEAGDLLSSTLDEKSVARDVVGLLARSGRGSVALLDVQRQDGTWSRLAAAAALPAHAEWTRAVEVQPVPAGGLLEEAGAFEEGEPRLYPSLDAEALRRAVRSVTTRRLLARLGVGSALRLPLRARGRFRGTLWLLGSPGAFSERDLGWTRPLASRVALALDNAGLFAIAQAALGEKEDLVRMVAHELRNPLSTCRMAASLVRRALPAHPEVALRAAENGERASVRAEEIIRDLLARAPRDGAWRLQPGTLTVDTLLPELDALSEGLRRDARWELAVEPGLPAMRADAGRLLQVLGNLLSNAFRHAPPGGRVRLEISRDSGAFLRFRVSDDGPGIPAALYPRLFQRGVHGPGGGNGLGLYVARQLVEAMGGQLQAEPPSGHGAVFSFNLPIAAPEVHVPA